MEPQLLPLPHAAQALGIGVSKLRQLIAAGEITGVHIGRRHLIPAHAVRAFVDQLGTADTAAARSHPTVTSQVEKGA